MSPTGTRNGDIHMPRYSRMVVDAHAQVDTIPIGDHSSHAISVSSDRR